MDMLYQNPEQKTLRQKLRNGATDSERKMWSALRQKQILGLKFTRQYGIGKFVVDFYCPTLRLAIELDGSQHMEQAAKEHDEKRTNFINSQAIQVIRFYDNEVLNNLEGVIERLIQIIKALPV